MSQLYRCSWYSKCFEYYAQRNIYMVNAAVRHVPKRTLLTNRPQILQSSWLWPKAREADASRVTLSTSTVYRTQDSGKTAGDGEKSQNSSTSAAGGPSVVYVGTLARMVRFVKLFSLSSSIVGISIQPYIYQNVSQLPIALAAVVGGFMGFFILVTPLILHFVTKRYVTAITLDRATGRFVATTYSFFLNEKHLEFTASDVKVPTVPGLFTTVVVNGKVPLFVDPSLFVDRDAFLQMMRYDEPLEWEIEPEQEEGTKTQGKEQQKTGPRES